MFNSPILFLLHIIVIKIMNIMRKIWFYFFCTDVYILSPVHRGDKVETMIDIWVTKIAHFWQSQLSWTRSTLTTMSIMTRSTKSKEPATVEFWQTGNKSATNRGQSRQSTLSICHQFWRLSTLSPKCRTSFRLWRQCVPGFRHESHKYGRGQTV